MSMSCLTGGTPLKMAGGLRGGPCQTDRSQYQLGPVLASPRSLPAVVQLARQRNMMTVVVKRYLLDTGGDESEDPTSYIRHEVGLMRQLHHNHLQSCLSSLVSGQEVWLVTPLQAHGSVKDLVSTHFPQGLPELACTFLARDIISGLVYLHSQGVVHRALRCSHILVSESGSAVVSGLRYSTGLRSTGEHRANLYTFPLHGVEGNLCWLAPEVLQQNLLGYNETSDIYSLAVCLCEMANGVVPFSDLPPTLLLLEKLRGSTPRLMDSSTMGEQPEVVEGGFPGVQPTDSGVGDSVGSCRTGVGGDKSIYYERSFSPAFHEVVSVCSALDSAERPSASELLGHPWVKQLRKTNSTLLTLLHPLQSLVAEEEGEDEEEDELVLVKEMEAISV